jgi:hypothetical protein
MQQKHREFLEKLVLSKVYSKADYPKEIRSLVKREVKDFVHSYTVSKNSIRAFEIRL